MSRRSPHSPPKKKQKLDHMADNKENSKIVYINATPHPLNYLVQDDEGDIVGKIGNGQTQRFREGERIPKGPKEIRLTHGEAPVERTENGFRVVDYSPWTGTDMSLDILPAHDSGVDLAYLFVSLPTAQFLAEKRENGVYTNKPPVKTMIWVPNTGPESAVRDDTKILGVTMMQNFGELCLEPVSSPAPSVDTWHIAC